jgi:alpha-tubulin suppressor-like RCC1 family protein
MGVTKSGFALPTILIASFVMLFVLVAGLTSVAATVTSLGNMHYDTFAKNAAQSGLAMARACLKANNYEPQWTSPLRPNTNCAGSVVTGLSEYISNEDEVRSTFSVPAPTTLANGVQRVSVTATTDRLRASTSLPWRSYTQNEHLSISGQTSFDSITFGYVGGGDASGGGAFFATIGATGVVTGVGANMFGQLGNGTTSNTTSPREFLLPTGTRVMQLYSNFLSQGYTLFAITSDGRLFGAGSNTDGQLGNGTTSAIQSTPVQFQLPAGVQARYVASGARFTYVIGSNNNVYAVGQCDQGVLGYTYTIAGCTAQSTYRRVALPAVNTSDPNTLPVVASDWVQSTNLATDRRNAYVRMQGGAVYGWGANEYGQLGNGTTNDSSTPVRYGTLGASGQPQARQVAFDGDAVWVLDSNGDVWASGFNYAGQLGTSTPVRSSTGFCFDNPGNAVAAGSQVRIYTCNDSTAQMVHFDEDNSIKFHPDTSTVLCLDNANGSSANGNILRTYACNGTVAQKWVINDNGSITNPATGKCIDNPGNSSVSGTNLQLHDCNGTPAQQWTFGTVKVPMKVWLPAGQGKVARIATDQATTVFLMTNGQIYGTGRNQLGQLGTGTTNAFNPFARRFNLPSGRTAENFYTTADGVNTSSFYRANTYAVLDNGTVYGSGSNNFGQLGTGSMTTFESTPRRMLLPAGATPWVVQSGFGTTVVLTQEGRIFTTGSNSHGQLGDGTTTNSATPQAREYVNTRPLLLY